MDHNPQFRSLAAKIIRTWINILPYCGEMQPFLPGLRSLE